MPEQADNDVGQQTLAVRELVTRDADATRAVGQALGAAIRPGQVIALRGDLGAGKTTFVQGLAQGLGVRARVSSPTFVLVNEYAGRDGMRLVHADTYRLGASVREEAEGMGLAELLEDANAVVAIEWAERVQELLPADCLLIELGYGAGEDERTIRISASGPHSAAALHKLAF